MITRLLDLTSSLHHGHDLATSLEMLSNGVHDLTGFSGVGVGLILPSGDQQAVAGVGSMLTLLEALPERLVTAGRWEEFVEESEVIGQLHHHRASGLVFARLLGREGRLVGSLAGVLPAGRTSPELRDCQLLEHFAVHAALLIDQVRSQGALVQNVVLREREQAAEDLHDLVVQRIFAATLRLDMAQTMGMSDAAKNRVNDVLDDLDGLATQMRAAIRGARRDPDAPDAGARMEQATLDAASTLGFLPQLAFSGNLRSVTAHTVAELESVLGRALSCIALDRLATEVRVALDVTVAEVTLEIIEFGGTVRADIRAERVGLTDLQHRAGLVRGTCSLVENPGGGTLLRWAVPNG